MAFTQGVIGGLAAGQRFAEGASRSEARRQTQISEQQQARKQEVQTAIDDVAKTAKELNEQFSIQRAAAPSAEDQAKIDQQYGQMFDSIQSQVSRVATEAAESGVPVDPQIELSKLMAAGRLRDLRAEQVVEATGAGRKKGAEETAQLQAQTAEQPLKGATPFINQETGETVFITQGGEMVSSGGQLSRLPTTRVNIEQQPPETAQPQQEFEGVGQQVMEDIRQSTGIAAGISKGLSKVGGQFVPGANPRLDAEQRVKNFNQEVKFAFSRNPRFPVSEIERIQANLLPDPEAMITDPESESNKIPLLRQNLIDLNESDRLAFEGMSEKGKKESLDRMATRQAILNLIGDVPEIGGADEADIRIDALEQKGLESLTPAEKNELRELLKAQGLL